MPWEREEGEQWYEIKGKKYCPRCFNPLTLSEYNRLSAIEYEASYSCDNPVTECDYTTSLIRFHRPRNANTPQNKPPEPLSFGANHPSNPRSYPASRASLPAPQ
jgi:hypothetical protein